MNLSMNGSNLANYSFYLKLLQQCINANTKRLGLQAHGHLLVGGLSSNQHLGTKLIIFYSRSGANASARKVFDRMPQRSVVAWTALISGHSQHGKWEEALMVFSDMHREGVKFNQFTYGSALKACTGLQCLSRGEQVQGSAQKGRFVENVFIQSALVDLYSKCGEMERAFHVFDGITQRDLVSWNGIIAGFANQGFHFDAFSMFRRMLREGFLPDSFTLGSLLRASADSDGVKEVDTIHNIMIQLGFESHSSLTGSLVDGYVRCGSMEKARQVYEHTKDKDVISCTALITGYSREGSHHHHLHEAVKFFNEMRQTRARIDKVMFCSLLSLCANTASLCLGKQIHCSALCHQDVPVGNALIDMYSKSGDVESAKRVFNEMEKNEKNLVTWTSLISGLGRNGYGSEAVSLYEKMETEEMKPNEVTFLSLLSACSHSGLTREGWRCFEKLVQNHGVKPRPEHISCLVDLLSRAGYVEEAYNLVRASETVPDASVWAGILRGCIASRNMVIGEEAAKHLVKIDPKNSVNYVSISGMYADAGFWDCSMKAREFLKHRSLLKTRGCSYICR